MITLIIDFSTILPQKKGDAAFIYNALSPSVEKSWNKI